MINERSLAPEDELAELDDWALGLEQGRVEAISSALLSRFFEAHGADFDLAPEILRGLAEYTNKAKAPSLRAVWGERYDQYRQWSQGWVESFEQTNPALPRLKKSGSPTSGGLHFLGELTSYASENLSFEDLKTRLEARVGNGRAWTEGRRAERVKIKVPAAPKPILLASISPGFVSAAWQEIKTWS